ncbi:hypothetical protein [Amycolatopsis echigonensis]|uniref:Uncharacterized protein n=1 Tax=Amycolatopsis echigonensis TaxID=2576905 RepID=A0A2N3WE63_9PSEU|nr:MULTISPECIES: hypothetical protein [Amycolatopsis]MBB2499656.1 hypothetical protein [Amycolatopsis echigonensis]PKV92186.1 hypothetical protein ATK30_2981 [Amycolatopsis niigatensis]
MRILSGALVFLVLAAVFLFFLGWRVTAPQIVRPAPPPVPSSTASLPGPATVTVTGTSPAWPGR